MQAAILELQRELANLRAEVARNRTQLDQMFRRGRVTDVDTKKQLYRQEIGLDENGDPVKSHWISYSQHAGALKAHIAPSIGQQMMMIAPNGDPTQGFGLPLTWSDKNTSPGSSSDPVITFGGIKITATDSALTIAFGDAAMIFSKSNIKLDAPSIDFKVEG